MNLLRRARTTAPSLLTLAAVVLVTTMCSSGTPSTNPTTPSTTSAPSTSSPTPTAASFDSPGPGVYQLGTVTETAASNPDTSTTDRADCLAGDTCRHVTVNCSAAKVNQTGVGFLSIGQPQGTPKGVIMLFSGGGGSKLWSQEAKNDLAFSGQSNDKSIDQQAAKMASDFLAGLQQQGFMTIQVRWQNAWLASPPGDQAGPARLACRPASLIEHVYTTYYQPMGVHPTGGQCGFCLTGNSGGASAIGYSLAFYGLGPITDAAVLTGGPPHAALDKACLNVPGFTYITGLLKVIDASYGYNNQRGPCANNDPSWADVWRRDGVDTGGNEYSYPDTRILLLLGGLDDTAVGPHQLAYYDKLKKAGNDVKQVTIPDMTHAITASDKGLSEIENWFTKA
jgi:hypothetical protein